MTGTILLDIEPYRQEAAQLYPQIISNIVEGRMDSPRIQTVTSPDGAANEFRVYGNLAAAKTVVVEGVPASARLVDASFSMRSSVEKAVYGPDVCVVTHQTYAPDEMTRFTKGKDAEPSQCREVRNGSFRPQAERLASILQSLDLVDEQDLVIKGFSGAADLAVEFAYQNITNPSFGQRRIDVVSATEPARSHPMSRFAKLRSTAKSGSDLYDNIVASDSPALLAAHGIDPMELGAKVAFKLRIAAKVARYLGTDPSGSWALLNGYATNQSLAQLNDMATTYKDQAPQQIVGRALDSTVTGPDLFAALIPSTRRSLFEVSGDHSVIDNLKVAALFALITAGELQKSKQAA
ncbi:MAG: hypothetical protein ABI221_02050 [Candidatus Saccharimonadales bacterium]